MKLEKLIKKHPAVRGYSAYALYPACIQDRFRKGKRDSSTHPIRGCFAFSQSAGALQQSYDVAYVNHETQQVLLVERKVK